jgi:glycosyltransferase involved in cell wall biosynthesis
MKFDIVGVDESYGSHRFSNNSILHALKDKVTQDSDLVFVWWVEKMFLDPKYSDIKDRLCNTNWFGVMHVPLLTPNWAMDGQNNLSSLYFDETWRKALERCKAIICLSEHMATQLRALYPKLNVVSAKHPVGALTLDFSYDVFLKKKQMVLIGAWLRNYDAFFDYKTDLRKIILLNKYANGYLKKTYANYSPNCTSLLTSVDTIDFLDDLEYDKLITASLVFLGVHETSANNALCECIASNTPFVAKKHPAIIEYCGADYPLLVDSYEEKITDNMVLRAHEYLKSQPNLKTGLSLDAFLEKIKIVYDQIKDEQKKCKNTLTEIFIATPTYNSSDTLHETLLSVFNQDLEGIVVHHHVQDGMSTDATIEILAEWAKKTNLARRGNYKFTYTSERDDGMYDAITKGLASFTMSDDSWMTWINSDDQLADDALQTICEISQINSKVGWITGFPSVIKENKESIVFDIYFSSSIVKNGLCDARNYRTVQQEGTFWKYKHWKKLEIDNVFSNYEYAGDFSLWCHLALNTELYQVEKSMGWFNRIANQLSVKHRDRYFDEVDLCKKSLEDISLIDKFSAKIIDLRNRDIRELDISL